MGDDKCTLHIDSNGLLKVLVEDIENLAKRLGGNPEAKLSVLIHYLDKETNEIKVWDGK